MMAQLMMAEESSVGLSDLSSVFYHILQEGLFEVLWELEYPQRPFSFSNLSGNFLKGLDVLRGWEDWHP